MAKDAKKTCFVLMPFKADYRQVFDFVIKPTVESLGYRCIRGDDIKAQRNIMRDVIENISAADVVVADLTDSNPNVFYELGVSHALGRPTIMITQSVENFVPFDLRPYRTIEYRIDFEGADNLKQQLREAILALEQIDPGKRSSNPVTDFLPRQKSLDQTKAELAKAREEVARLREKGARRSDRQRLLSGIAQLAEYAAGAIGPLGRPIVVSGDGAPKRTRNLLEVAHDLSTGDDVADAAIKLFLSGVEEARAKYPDLGVKRCALLTYALLSGAVEAIEKQKIAPAALRAGLELGKAAVIEHIRGGRVLPQPSAFSDLIDSGDRDENLVGQAIRMSIPNGTDRPPLPLPVVVETGDQYVTDGMVQTGGERIPAGYLSPYFVTDPDTQLAVLSNPYVLVSTSRFQSIKQLVPLLEKVVASGRPLQLIAEAVENEALATLIVNKLRGNLKVSAVNAPGSGDQRSALLNRIAILTGMKTVWSEGSSSELALEDLGDVRKIISSARSTLILGKELPEGDGENHRFTVIQIAATGREAGARRARMEERLQFLESAFAEGIVPGAGVAGLRARGAMEKLAPKGGRQAGMDILSRALDVPLRAILRSAGAEEDKIIARIERSREPLTYDITSDDFGVFPKTSVRDTYSSTAGALETAVALAELMLSTNVLTSQPKRSELSEEKTAEPSPQKGRRRRPGP